MVRKPSSIAIVTLVLAVVLAACGKGPDLTRSKAAAFELIGKYGPQVSGLIGVHAELKARADKLPAQPGIASALDAQQATIARLKGLLDGYAVTIESAAKAGQKAGIDKAAAAFSADMEKGIADA